jgi:hypothetical protein
MAVKFDSPPDKLLDTSFISRTNVKIIDRPDGDVQELEGAHLPAARFPQIFLTLPMSRIPTDRSR